MKINRTLIIIIAAVFVAGLLSGFGIWGRKQEKEIDVKQLLYKAIEEVENIEKQNNDLKTEIDKNKSSIKKAAEFTNNQQKLADEIAGLTKDKHNLQGQVQKLKQGNESLIGEAVQLRAELSKAGQEAQVREEVKALNDELQNKIIELEDEIQNLRSTMNRIGSMTKGQEPVDSDEHLEKEAEINTQPADLKDE